MELQTYPDRDALMRGLATQIVDDLTAQLARQGSATLAVPGGTTPGPVFDLLNTADLDWGRVTVMLSDERWVPETSERSNTRLLKQRLLINKTAEAKYVPLYMDSETPEPVLNDLSESVSRHLPLSVVLLGMGADMHTASLFPGADRLEEGLDRAAPAVLPMRAAGAPEPRITLTAPVLDGAGAKHVLITGPEKRAALEEAEPLTADQAPIKAVWRNLIVHWAE